MFKFKIIAVNQYGYWRGREAAPFISYSVGEVTKWCVRERRGREMPWSKPYLAVTWTAARMKWRLGLTSLIDSHVILTSLGHSVRLLINKDAQGSEARLIVCTVLNCTH